MASALSTNDGNIKLSVWVLVFRLCSQQSQNRERTDSGLELRSSNNGKILQGTTNSFSGLAFQVYLPVSMATMATTIMQCPLRSRIVNMAMACKHGNGMCPHREK